MKKTFYRIAVAILVFALVYYLGGIGEFSNHLIDLR